MVSIQTVFDIPRECGWRKPGGLYLRLDGRPWKDCGRMPIQLDVCHVCGSGYRRSRIPYWIDGDRLVAHLPDCPGDPTQCRNCLLSGRFPLGQVLLLWVGEKYYPTPALLTSEAQKQGISRRINTIPRGFEIGQTWVFLAHNKAIQTTKTGEKIHGTSGSTNIVYAPGIFAMFRPERIEYVIKEDDPQGKLEALTEKGITLVRIMRITEQEAKTALLFPMSNN